LRDVGAGPNWGDPASTRAGRKALAKRDPDRFGPMAEGPKSAPAVEPPPATLRSPEAPTAVPQSEIPTLRRPEPIAVPEPQTVPRPATPAEPAPATQRSPELPYVPESGIPTQRIPEPEPFPQTQRTGEAPAQAH